MYLVYAMFALFERWLIEKLKNIREINRFQKIMPSTSSKENKTPPSGAPNATDTPAAAAADRSSRTFACDSPMPTLDTI